MESCLMVTAYVFDSSPAAKFRVTGAEVKSAGLVAVPGAEETSTEAAPPPGRLTVNTAVPAASLTERSLTEKAPFDVISADAVQVLPSLSVTVRVGVQTPAA